MPVAQGARPRHSPHNHNSFESRGFAQRLFYAYTLWQGRHGQRLTQTELGKHIGRMVGYKVGQYTVSDWFRGETIPPILEIEAIARCLEVDPGWLSYGKATVAPGPFDHVLANQEPMRRR